MMRVQRFGRSYRVVDETGKQVGPLHASRDHALTRAMTLMAPPKTERRCLRCGKTFLSSGPGERLCSAACRRPDPAEPFDVTL